MTPHVKLLIRRGLIAIVVIAGGVLQSLYASASHPSTLLKVWAWSYGVLGVLAIAAIVIHGLRHATRPRD